MSHPYAERDGDVAVESSDEPRGQPEASLVSMLRAAGRLQQRLAGALELVGLSHTGYEVLTHLEATPGPVPLEALANGGRLPDAAILDELAGQGLIRITVDGSSRTSRVALTPLGSARAREGRTQLDDILLEFAARFGARERAALRRLLARVAR